VNEADNHLDFEQIEQLLEGQPVALDEVQGDKLAAISQHLSGCASCQNLISMYERTGRDLHKLMADRPQSRTPQCPDQQVVRELAAGVPSPEQSERLLKHVVGCDHCGPIFRLSLAEFDEDDSESEKNIFARLETSKLEWQAGLARRLAVRELFPVKPALLPFSMRKGRVTQTFLQLAAVAAVAVLVWIGFRTYLREQPFYTNRLLAKAYVTQRTLEIRIPGAEFAPMRVERGGPRSRLDRPAALLEAEEIIARKLASSPEDPEWLQAKGRADLLDGNYTAAISDFEKALEGRPDAPDLQADLAAAYFSLAESEDRASYYSVAIELFGKALQKEPDNSVVLFNRAMSFEKMFLYEQALEDWAHYLRVAPSGSWAAEARRHVEQLKLKQHERDDKSLHPLLQPEDIGKQRSLHDTSIAEIIGLRVEEYQSAALKEWLTAAFPVHSIRSAIAVETKAREAVANVATIGLAEHEDAWLHDLMLSSSSPEFPAAIAELRNAVVASEHADYERALKEANRARRTFAAIGSTAGVFRADFERVFALQFSINAQECVRDLGPLLQSLSNGRYPWILSQAEIEEGICENLLGEFGPAEAALSAALSHARMARYSVTASRALTMSGLVNWSAGSGDLAWQQLREGAATCWSAGCPPMTLYSVYANMDNFAEDSRQWQLQMAIAKEAVLTIGSNPDLLMRAVEYSRLAKAAVLAQAPEVPEKNFAIAARLLAMAPQTQVTRHYEAGINVELAKLASEQRKVGLAQHYLDEVRPQLADLADHYILMDYFRTLGRLKLQEGDLPEADKSLRWAVVIAEKELSSLSSDRDRLAWMIADEDTYRDWVSLELQRGHPELALHVWEFFLASSLRSERNASTSEATPKVNDVFLLNRDRKGPPQFPVLHELTSNAPLHHETLISYAILPERVVAWVVDDRGIFFVPLTENVDALLLVSRRFKRACASPNSTSQSLLSDGRYLYRELVEPLSAHLDSTRTLLFDGDTILADIPMQALVDDGGNYLGDTYSTGSIPSMGHLSRLRPSSALTPHDPALVVSVSGSGSVVREGTPPLLDAGDEAKTVAQRFVYVRLIQEKDAKFEAVEREIRRAVVFHYAGHTSIGTSGNGMLLTGETSRNTVSLLDAATIRSLHPGILQLAVLSACSSESAGRRGLQDADSLTLAFLEAGVPHVIASRWDVDSVTTTKLMSSFYDRLLAGKSVSDAIRAAALEIRSDPSTRKPYYWAAFSSFGAT
jgi:CHAT domain-containing protein/tetratricopeptide (TPR) repeat protein